MSLRAALLATGLVAVAAGTAQADPSGLYGGVSAGWSHLDGIDSSGSTLGFSATPSNGFLAVGRLGYAFGPLRFEGEVGYRRQGIDALTVGNDGGLGARLGKGSLTGASASPAGSVTALSFMANGLYDVAHVGPLTPYVGVGLGGAELSLNSLAVSGTTIANGSDFVFAYQGIAGIRYRLGDQLSLGVSYRYFATADASFKDASGVPFHAGYASHNVLLDLVYYFGGQPGGGRAAETVPPEPAWRSAVETAPAPAAPPPAVPSPAASVSLAPPSPPPPVSPPRTPPAAPAPAPVVAHAAVPARPPAPRTFMVFFDFGRAALTPAGARTIQAAAQTAAQQGGARIDLTGYGDTADVNLALAQRRAEAVRSYLLQLGVARDTITVTDRRHEATRQQDRRIDIII
jgi:opacity protein-like surface antigen/outer membrane protein OmpA-like peptidoglycan-associated protein